MTDLASLIDRLERATGPDREMDLTIQIAIYPDGDIAKLMQFRRGLDGKIGMAWDIWGNSGSVVFEKRDAHGNCYFNGGYPLPNYTSSIDAALTLLPPGFWWRGGTCSVSSEVCVCPDHNDPKHRERLLRDYPPTNPIWDEGIEVELRPGSDHAFCRAFAAACLRARAQSEGEKE